MKNLILIRHAHAESENLLQNDFERKLIPQGILEAEKLGAFIKTKKDKPDYIIASSAYRTLETAKIASENFNFPAEKIFFKIELYNSSFQKLIEQIRSLDSSIINLALVGHNPGISQLSTALVASGSYQLAPSAAVSLRFEIRQWSELTAGTGTENWYYYP